MAKFVIAGVANCPRYAQIELLADKLALNLPDFKLHKITKLPTEWESWLKEVCAGRGWTHSRSPIVWRELIDRGGKGMLIGGANEFQEYVACYYGLQSDFTSDDSLKVAAENLNVQEEEDATIRSMKASIKPVNVCITTAASPAGYAFVSAVASGAVFGRDTRLSLRLCDADDKRSALSGVAMEVVDLASGSVHDASVDSDPTQSFADCDVIVLLDDVVRDAGEDRSGWLHRVHDHFADRAKIIARVARPGVLVVVAGGGVSANFAGAVICRTAPEISPSSVVVMSRLVENRARAAIAARAGINAASVVNLVVWGDASGSKSTRFAVDASRAQAYDCEHSAVWGPGHSVPVAEIVHDERWLRVDLPRAVAGDAKRPQGSGAMPLASALSSLIRDWWCGTSRKWIHSLAVCSKGWFGIPDGLFFSVPVKFTAARKYTVVRDFAVTDEMSGKLQKIIQELESDIEVVYPNPNKVIRVPSPLQRPSSVADPPPEQPAGLDSNGIVIHHVGDEVSSDGISDVAAKEIDDDDKINEPESVSLEKIPEDPLEDHTVDDDDDDDEDDDDDRDV
jgi:malate/lactate dehydrogenase